MSTRHAAQRRAEAAVAATTSAAGNANEANFEEPDPASIATVVTGRHVWAAQRNQAGTARTAGGIDPPVVPFEDLPFPRTDRAKIAACAVRWVFTGCFNFNREENAARGSLTVQVKRFLERAGFINPAFTVNFPRGVGRGRFVDVCVQQEQMAVLPNAPLVFHGAPLQRHLIGPILSRTAMVLEVTNFSENEDLSSLARQLALFLQPFARVHDIWAELHTTPGDDTPRLANKLHVLVETDSTASGGRDPSKVQAIPGYINLGGNECELSYVGRLPWCTICRSRITQYHAYDTCPHRLCFNCRKPGHSAAQCTEKPHSWGNNDEAVQQLQAVGEARVANELDHFAGEHQINASLIREMDQTSVQIEPDKPEWKLLESSKWDPRGVAVRSSERYSSKTQAPTMTDHTTVVKSGRSGHSCSHCFVAPQMGLVPVLNVEKSTSTDVGELSQMLLVSLALENSD